MYPLGVSAKEPSDDVAVEVLVRCQASIEATLLSAPGQQSQVEHARGRCVHHLCEQRGIRTADERLRHSDPKLAMATESMM